MVKMSNKKYIETLVKEQIQLLLEEAPIWTVVGDKIDQDQLSDWVNRLKRKYEGVKLKRIDMSKWEEDLHDILEVWIKDTSHESTHNYLSTFMEMYPVSKSYSNWVSQKNEIERQLLVIKKVVRLASLGDTSSVQYKINALRGIKDQPGDMPQLAANPVSGYADRYDPSKM